MACPYLALHNKSLKQLFEDAVAMLQYCGLCGSHKQVHLPVSKTKRLWFNEDPCTPIVKKVMKIY